MEYEDVLEKCYNLLSDNPKIIEIYNDEDHIYFSTKVNTYLICCPHSGNDYKWLFRKGKIKGFDRWANSTREEQFYESPKDLFKRIGRI